MVLASRTSRNLFAAYCVALHLLVFLSLYWMGAAGADQAATNFGQTAAAAGAAVAGGSGGGSVAGPGGTGHGSWKEGGFDET